MAKSIVKELIIILLLCLAIILVLGVLLYEYIPNDKIIPEPVAYVTPESVKDELNNNAELDEYEKTYALNAIDLNNYQRIDSYVPGKPNPFSSYQTNAETTNQGGGTGSSGTSSGSSNSSNNNSNSNNNSSTSTTNSSSGGYLPDKGTK